MPLYALTLLQDDLPTNNLLRSWEDVDVTWIVLTCVLAWLVIALFARLVNWLGKRLPTRLRYYVLPWPPIVRLFVILAAIGVITPLILVPRPEAMFAIAGSGAVALGFAFKDYVSSLIAGVVVLFERPCSVGDWVRVGDVYGKVVAMRLRVIQLVTPDDDRVSIPHSRIWSASVHNANGGRPDHMCVAEFHLDPAHDARAVRAALEDVALTSAYRNLDRRVTVVASEQRFVTRWRLKAYPFDGADQFTFLTDLTVRGKRALLELGARPARPWSGAPDALSDPASESPGSLLA